MNFEFLKKIENEAAGLFEQEPHWFTDEETTAVLLGFAEGEVWLAVWTTKSIAKMIVQLQFVGNDEDFGKSLQSAPRLLHTKVSIKNGYGAAVLPKSWKSVPKNEVAITVIKS